MCGHLDPVPDEVGFPGSEAGWDHLYISIRQQHGEGYQGSDRGFVLRFLNAGTADRMITSYTDRDGTRHTLRSGRTSNIRTHATGGNRGSIAARNWFGSASHKALENASLQMQELIDRIIAQEFV